MSIQLQTYSYRFAEEIFHSKLSLKREIEDAIYDSTKDLSILSHKRLNTLLKEKLLAKEWEDQPRVFNADAGVYARLDFAKERVGVEVQFGHPSFIGIDLLKFQAGSYSNVDKIDFGVYIVSTKKFQKYMVKNFQQKWNSSLSYEKVTNYLPHMKSAIQVPIYVIGIDV